MKLIDSVLATVVLVAGFCCLVAAAMDRESCKSLYESPNGNWESRSQISQCCDLLGNPRQLYKLMNYLTDSTKHTNCNDKSKHWEIHHLSNLENGMDGKDKQPASIKRAYIAYGLRLSATCRNSMINIFKYKQLEEFLTEDDFAALAPWTDDKSPVAKLFALANGSKGLALPSAMVKLLKAGDNVGRIIVKLPPGTSFARAHVVCNRRFKPIYRQITDPLIGMAINGFNYIPDAWNTDAETLGKVHQWDRAVFVCKLLEQVDIVEDDTMEAGQIKVTETKSIWSTTPLKSPSYYPEVKELDFKYGLVDGRNSTGKNWLVNLNDPQLMKAIKNYHEPSTNLGLKASLKMAGSALAQKVANTFGDNNKADADQDDKEIANFLADYTKKLESANSRFENSDQKRTPREEIVFKWITRIIPIFWGVKGPSVWDYEIKY